MNPLNVYRVLEVLVHFFGKCVRSVAGVFQRNLKSRKVKIHLDYDLLVQIPFRSEEISWEGTWLTRVSARAKG